MSAPGYFFLWMMFMVLLSDRARRDDAAARATPAVDRDPSGRPGREEGARLALVMLVGIAASGATAGVLGLLYGATVGTMPPSSLASTIIFAASAGSALVVWAILRPHRAGRLFERFERALSGERTRTGLLVALSVLILAYALLTAAFEIFIIVRLVVHHESWEPMLYLLLPVLAAASAVLAWIVWRASGDRGLFGRCGRAWSAAVEAFHAPGPGEPKPKTVGADHDFD